MVNKSEPTKMDEAVVEYLHRIARKGGKATVKNHGKNYMRKLSKLALEKRWGKK